MPELLEEPVVERPVVLELERAERVRDALDRVGLAVGAVVHRVDAPGVAGAVVGGVQDAVQHRVAQVQVGATPCRSSRAARARRRGTRRRACARSRSRFSSTDAVAVRAVAARLGQRAAVRADLLGGQVVDVGLALARSARSAQS